MVAEAEEAVVVCSDKSMKIGIDVWDMETGDNLLHIHSCASPPYGLLCSRNRFLVASQINRHGSVGGGSIVAWPLQRVYSHGIGLRIRSSSCILPQQSLLNYTTEAVGPLSCTKDGIYLVGGALSGNAYIWDVTSGKLLKTWRAHNKSIKCLLFSDDNSFLISGSDDGMICVWSLISLLDVEETGSSPSLLHCLQGHTSPITSFLTTPGYFSVLISSSLDGTCKVWDFILGRLLQTQVYPEAITSIALHEKEMLLFYGTENGTIIVNKLDIGLEEGPSIATVDQPLELKAHNGAITALTSCQTGLVSASEDCTICLWDVINHTIIRKFNLQKGRVTNLVVIPRSSLLSTSTKRRVSNSNQYTVSPLEKHPPPINSFKGTTTLVSLPRLNKENQIWTDLRSSGFLRQNMSRLQRAHMPTAMSMQMKMETSIESRISATNMAKHVMAMNRQLQSQLLDLMRLRLNCPDNINQKKSSTKKPNIQSLLPTEENKKS